MTVVHGSYSSSIVLGCVTFWILAMKCMAMDLRDMDIATGSLVEGALVKSQVTVLDACAVANVTEANFRKALKGETYRHVSVNHIIKIGIRYPMFAVHFTADLMWFVVKHRAAEIVETVSVRKSA